MPDLRTAPAQTQRSSAPREHPRRRQDGSRIRLAGKGEPGRAAARAGDLYVITHVDESPVFKRKGDNLEVEVPLTIPEALARRGRRGADARRHARSCASPPGTKHGTRAAPARRGPAAARAASGRGDIHYRFVIDVPKELTPEQARRSTSCRR